MGKEAKAKEKLIRPTMDSPVHVKKDKWSLKKEAFDNLLVRFAVDRDCHHDRGPVVRVDAVA